MFSVPCRCCPCCPPPSPTLNVGLGAGYFQSCDCMPCGKLVAELAEDKKGGGDEDDRSRYERLLPILASLEADRKVRVRMKLENSTERRKIQGLAKFRTEVNMEERKMDLERRSDKLRRRLEDEMCELTQEKVNEFIREKETRLDRMRERVMVLREKREKEEKILVQAKLKQLFESTSEELRTCLVKRTAKQIAKDWDEQLKLKCKIECEEAETDDLYAKIALGLIY